MASRISKLENAITRMADSLDLNVLPHVENHYARLQLRAAREMLLNLGTRVEWRHEDVAASIAQVTLALETLSRLDPAPAVQSSVESESPAANLETLRARLTGFIVRLYDESQEARREEALETIWRVIRFDFDTEAQRTRTGMYSPRQE